MTKHETLAALTIVATFFPHTFEISDEVMFGIWHRELAPYPAEAVEVAIRDLCRTQAKFPSLKDVLDRLGVNVSPTHAWRQACEAARAIGPTYRGGQAVESGKLPPAVKAAAEAVGGLPAIRVRTMEDEPAMRAHFFRAFEEATRSDKGPAYLGEGHQSGEALRQAAQLIGRPMPQLRQSGEEVSIG